VQQFFTNLEKRPEGDFGVYQLFRRSAPHVRSTRRCMLAAARKHGSALANAADVFKGDKEMVLAGMANRGLALLHAAGLCKCDKEIVLAAVAQDGYSLKYVNKQAPTLIERDFVLSMVKLNSKALVFDSDQLRKNREVVKAAANQTGNPLEFASDQLRENREIVKAAVSQTGSA